MELEVGEWESATVINNDEAMKLEEYFAERSFRESRNDTLFGMVEQVGKAPMIENFLREIRIGSVFATMSINQAANNAGNDEPNLS